MAPPVCTGATIPADARLTRVHVKAFHSRSFAQRSPRLHAGRFQRPARRRPGDGRHPHPRDPAHHRIRLAAWRSPDPGIASGPSQGQAQSEDEPEARGRAPAHDARKELSRGENVGFCPDCVGPEAAEMAGKLEKGQALLLENLRFHAEEEANDEKFSKQLAVWRTSTSTTLSAAPTAPTLRRRASPSSSRNPPPAC